MRYANIYKKVLKVSLACGLGLFTGCTGGADNSICKDNHQSINDIREEIKSINIELQKATETGNYNEENYNRISKVIEFIKKSSDFEVKQLDTVVFLVGPTGVGKSTLSNYLAHPNNMIVNDRGKLELKNPSLNVASIGKGNVSTTIFPNIWELNNMTFIDCAGDMDCAGVVANIINSIIKSKIAGNVKKAKIVFMASQGSLGAEGSYGVVFKQSLDSNARFLRDINSFQDNIAFVISHASRRDNALKNCMNDLDTILKQHNNLGVYKDTLEFIVSKKRVTTFSKPSDEVEPGSVYAPPQWNRDQNKTILQLIDAIGFKEIPSKDFFNVSSSRDMQVAIQDALKIVKIKAVSIITGIMQANTALTIYSVEAKPFMLYVADLRNGIPTSLEHFVKILKWNGYFKVEVDNKIVKQLDEEISFLSQFTEDKIVHFPKGFRVKENWIAISDGVTNLLNRFYDDVKSVLDAKNAFACFESKKFLTTKPVYPISVEIKKDFASLYDKYENKVTVEKTKKNDQTSDFFKDKAEQVFSHTDKKPITMEVKYEDAEAYTEEEEYKIYKKVQRKQKVIKDVIKYKTETKTESIPVEKIIQETYTDFVPYDKQVEVEEYAGFGWTLLKFGTLGMVSDQNIVTKNEQNYRPETRTRDKTVVQMEKVDKEVQVAYADKEETYEMRPDVEEEIGKRPVTKYKKVEKTKTETKLVEDKVYKEVMRRVFSEEVYKDYMQHLKSEIDAIQKSINTKLNTFPNVALGPCNKEEVTLKDEKEQIEAHYKDLLERWRDAEYKAYFAQHPNRSLEDLSLQAIVDRTK